ncbi:DUF3558 domain-containing protein [Saccharothrix algeriensis]|uniref:DUF3558 domain-containing protein n=1 Tax=Saccharothrix algeriensis TaxID=173560 RepID=A0A8T8HRD3_9PSEU|nr:DUF3558 domain-containing protein [Saccharothrix algeriensis]MBM7812386.1 hypothetical protein [Saccharothrix algeriensis]QTR01143.1 DUF3558 domain-containing protein [Saccharothrix algeriensis]
MRPVKSAAVACAAFAVLVGCSSGEKGNPTPDPSAVGASESGATETAAPSPQRPKEIKLEGVDPCSLVSKEQREQWGAPRVENRPTEVVKGAGASPSCSFVTGAGVQPSFSYNLSLITGKGVEYWTSTGNLDVAEKEVGGYPAKQVNFKGTSKTDCFVAVDVADGQQLYVQFLPISRIFSQDQMCQNAAKGAETALATLQTLK